MGVYIKNMETPKHCAQCVMRYSNCKTRVYMGNRPSLCPLVEVKEPHGRLIDADALVNTVVFHTNVPADTKEFIEDLIGIAPTVIEVEEG